MKKKAKKLGSLLLAMVLILTMSLPVTAASAGSDRVYGGSDDTGTITVYGIEDEAKESGLTVTAYPIILASYDSNDNFKGYVSLYSCIDLDDIEKTETDSSGNTTYSYGLTEALLDTVRNLIAGGSAVTADEIRTATNNANAAASYSLLEDTSNSGYTADVPVGSYLAIIKDAEAVVYNVAVVSYYYVINSEGTGNEIQDNGVDMIKDGVSWVKSATPDLDKKITNGDVSDNDSATSKNIGDTVDYQVTVDNIPYYGGEYPVFQLTDTLSEGLTLITKNSSGDTTNTGIVVRVYVGAENTNYPDADADGYITLTENTDYKVTVSADAGTGVTTLIINFVLTETVSAQTVYTYTLNDYEGKELVVTYSAELNENAVMAENGNDNHVVLDYTTDSTVQRESAELDDKTYTYTFDIDGVTTSRVISKVGNATTDDGAGNEVRDPLEGAQFTLYTKNAATGSYETYTSDKYPDGCIVESDSDGQISIYSLATGTYYLKETKAPTGYTLNTTMYTIVISAAYNTNGTLQSWKIVISDESGTIINTSTFEVGYVSDSEGVVTDTVLEVLSDKEETKILNTKIISLPSTGGMGTIVFTILGCVIMITAAGLYLGYRRRMKNQ
ncbi:MAG: isopeptide-forming domain-containing fimbrial protein [Lachnospiraceae bacterium]|nr:isopeptide-forming domain-containing fimbrial protein [Lachnospiraceae bacterium]